MSLEEPPPPASCNTSTWLSGRPRQRALPNLPAMCPALSCRGGAHRLCRLAAQLHRRLLRVVPAAPRQAALRHARTVHVSANICACTSRQLLLLLPLHLPPLLLCAALLCAPPDACSRRRRAGMDASRWWRTARAAGSHASCWAASPTKVRPRCTGALQHQPAVWISAQAAIPPPLASPRCRRTVRAQRAGAHAAHAGHAAPVN